MAGIKETLEALEAVKKTAVLGTKTFKDGVQVSDLGALVEVAQGFKVYKDAFEGIDQVDDEFKDLDSAEATQLVAKVFEIIEAVKAEL